MNHTYACLCIWIKSCWKILELREERVLGQPFPSLCMFPSIPLGTTKISSSKHHCSLNTLPLSCLPGMPLYPSVLLFWYGSQRSILPMWPHDCSTSKHMEHGHLEPGLIPQKQLNQVSHLPTEHNHNWLSSGSPTMNCKIPNKETTWAISRD